MDLCEILGGPAADTEQHPVYQELEVANNLRQYSFLRSLVEASIATGKPFLSSQIMKALNFQAIACLHSSAGTFRPCRVVVGDYIPPEFHRVQALMDDFINTINRHWEDYDAVGLAAFVLWRLNFIHPFVNGNGRTARAACYFALCIRNGSWISGTPILPELIRNNRNEYIEALRYSDNEFKAKGTVDLTYLHRMLSWLLATQINSARQSVQTP